MTPSANVSRYEVALMAGAELPGVGPTRQPREWKSSVRRETYAVARGRGLLGGCILSMWYREVVPE